MDRRRILVIAIIGAVLVSVLSFIIPKDVGSVYVSVMQPLALFLGFLLALKVSSNYGRELKNSFLFLSLFLLLYMISNILPLWQYLYSSLGNTTTLYLIQILQIACYAMVLTSCAYTLRVIEVKRINRYGWIFIGLLAVLCVYILIRNLPTMNAISADPTTQILRLLITIFDMAIILMLVPVVLLYIQHLKSKAKESVTFTLIMGGLIFSIISTYIFELATGMSLDKIATDYFQKGSVLDAIYIFGYFIIAIGLYGNIKYSEWGYQAIVKALSSKGA
jgi:hypothetical protein